MAGSHSDLPVTKNAAMCSWNFKAIIAGAAHLPGMTDSLTSLAVNGVTVKASSLIGQNSLQSIVQMNERNGSSKAEKLEKEGWQSGRGLVPYPMVMNACA